jgi:hypothetical protein
VLVIGTRESEKEKHPLHELRRVLEFLWFGERGSLND